MQAARKFIIPPLSLSTMGDPKSRNPFVRRFGEISTKLTHKPTGNFPALRGQYEDWRDYIRAAVREDAEPCPELIFANGQLAAWEAHLRIGQVDSFPVSVSLNFTDVCNARCSFCAYVPERVAGSKLTLEKLERADWMKFVRSFRPNGGGLGEPFAHPQAHALFECLSRTAPYMAVGAVTNGSYLSEASAKLVAGYFSYVYVSLNAAKKETYEETMSPLKWEATLEKLGRLRDEARAAGRSLYMRAGYVVHTNNLEEMERLPDLLDELGFDDININPMVPPPSFGRDNLYTSKQSIYTVPDRANAVFRALERDCARRGIIISKALPTHAELRGTSKAEVETSGRSYEWAMFAKDGLEPKCWAPWRALKIDTFDKTLVCCNFFRKLPGFTWPDAREFHAPHHMWNHPYMVHLRSTMGTKDEVPFCTLCLQSDKRHLANAEAKKIASRASNATYARIMRAHEGRQTHGQIDEISGDIRRWRLPGVDRVLFKADEGHYRSVLAKFGFVGNAHVLHAGANWHTLGFSLFLAEDNDHVTVLSRASEIPSLRDAAKALGFANMTFLPDDAALHDNGFDALWMEQRAYEALTRKGALDFAARVLGPGGRLRVRNARGIGQNVLDVLDGAPDAEAALAALEAGVKHKGSHAYLTQDSTMLVLKLHGLMIDKTRPPSGRKALPGSADRAFATAAEYAAALRAGSRDREALLAGLDQTISFSCMTRPAPPALANRPA